MPTDRKRVIIVGAGFGGLSAAKALGSRDDGSPVEVTVDRSPELPPVPAAAVPGGDGGAGGDGHRVSDPRGAARQAQRLGAARRGDRHRRRGRAVRLDDGTALSYDYLVMAAGARTSYFGHDDWARVRARPQGPRRRAGGPPARADRAGGGGARVRSRASASGCSTFVVVGGGPTGVELAGAIADLSRDILAVDFKRLDRKAVRVVLVEMADRILTPFDPPLSAARAGAAGGAGRRGPDRRARRIDRRRRREGRRRDAARRDGAVGRGRAAEPAGGGAGRAARPRRPGHRRAGLRRARASRAVRHRRHGVVHARGRAGAAARHQPGRDPGRRAQVARNILDEVAGPAAPAVSLLRQGVHGDDRARARRRPAGAAAHVGAASPGCRGCSSTSGTWSASATALVRVHELDLGVRHLAPRRARDHRAPGRDRRRADDSGSGRQRSTARGRGASAMRASRSARSCPAQTLVSRGRSAPNAGRHCARRTAGSREAAVGGRAGVRDERPRSGVVRGRVPPGDRCRAWRAAAIAADHDLLVGKRLERAKLRHDGRDGRQHAAALGRDASVQRHLRVHVAVRRQPRRLGAVAEVAELVAAEVAGPGRAARRGWCCFACRTARSPAAPSSRPRRSRSR